MTRFTKGLSLVALTIALVVPMPLVAGGNGAFTNQFRGDEVGSNHEAWVQFEVVCNTGFTCGYATAEMDWDDGNFDNIVGPVSQTQYLEDEWVHEYAENGVYHGLFEVDDDLGNWSTSTIDFDIVN